MEEVTHDALTEACIQGKPSAISDSNDDDNAAVADAVHEVKKKRNRRKERKRNKKLVTETDEAASILPQIESLSLAPNGSCDKAENFPECTLSKSDIAENTVNSTAAESQIKKKKRKKRNVAISSIQNLSLKDDLAESLKSPSKPQVPRNEIVETFIANASKSVFQEPEKNGKVSSRRKPENPPLESNFQNNKRCHTLSKSSAGSSICSQTYSRSQENFGSPTKHGSPMKQKGSREAKNRSCANDELMLNENKFEPHLQRELVEVMLNKQQNVIKGFIRINQRNYREAYITNPDGSKDILIDGVKDRNRALEGDEVVLLILPESSWRKHDGSIQKVGKVIHILSQVHQRQAVGNLKKMQDGNTRLALFSPRDSRIPRIRIPIKECPKNPKDWEKGLFFARITEWDDVRFAKGCLMGDSFGAHGDIESETRAILLENELIFSPFNKDLYQYFSTPFKLMDHHLAGREDLRKLCIFTIDPITARDLDDAVSCEKLDNGNFKVGVHISDVSYFLTEGTPLDLEVAKRATTTYLVQRAYHMLPSEMTMMCSLLPGKDKLAFSVFWEMTPRAEVVSHYFTRSVINSCTQLAYEHAQIMIDDPEHEWEENELPKIHNGWNVKDIKERVLIIQSLAVIMRKFRFDTGALRVDQKKLSFNLDIAGEPISFYTYINKESHRLIEEFMLLANITVATALQQKFPLLAFLRCHDEPQQDMLKKLTEVLEKFGIVLDVSSAGSLHQSLQRYCSSEDNARFVALNSLCSKPMTRARYFCAATIGDVNYMRHYALNVPLYTHFTSPIRRYADVMVHRLLAALLGYCEEPKWTLDFVNKIVSNCNKMKFCAKKAGEQSTELFLALWVKKHGSMEEEAVVVDVKDRSFDAVVISSGCNIRVYTDKLPGSVVFDNTSVPQLNIQWAVAGGCSKLVQQVITMFSVVQVTLRSSNTNLLKIEATLNPPKL